MITVHYTADYNGLLSSADDAEDRAIIEAEYANYVTHLASLGAKIDYDSDQTTYCWSGADEWPDELPDFWSWYN